MIYFIGFNDLLPYICTILSAKENFLRKKEKEEQRLGSGRGVQHILILILSTFCHPGTLVSEDARYSEFSIPIQCMRDYILGVILC